MVAVRASKYLMMSDGWRHGVDGWMNDLLIVGIDGRWVGGWVGVSEHEMDDRSVEDRKLSKICVQHCVQWFDSMGLSVLLTSVLLVCAVRGRQRVACGAIFLQGSHARRANRETATPPTGATEPPGDYSSSAMFSSSTPVGELVREARGGLLFDSDPCCIASGELLTVTIGVV